MPLSAIYFNFTDCRRQAQYPNIVYFEGSLYGSTSATSTTTVGVLCAVKTNLGVTPNYTTVPPAILENTIERVELQKINTTIYAYYDN